MNFSVDSESEPRVVGLDFDDVVKVTLIARVKGINQDLSDKIRYEFEATITDIEQEKTSLRNALERGLKRSQSSSVEAYPG